MFFQGQGAARANSLEHLILYGSRGQGQEARLARQQGELCGLEMHCKEFAFYIRSSGKLWGQGRDTCILEGLSGCPEQIDFGGGEAVAVRGPSKKVINTDKNVLSVQREGALKAEG